MRVSCATKTLDVVDFFLLALEILSFVKEKKTEGRMRGEGYLGTALDYRPVLTSYACFIDHYLSYLSCTCTQI